MEEKKLSPKKTRSSSDQQIKKAEGNIIGNAYEQLKSITKRYAENELPVEMDIEAKPGLGEVFLFMEKKHRKFLLRLMKLRAYEKKTGESVQSLIKTARAGNKRINRKAFFELIQLDKEFLFVDWAKQLILDELEKDNRYFFENLGEAIKKFPRQNKNTQLIKELEKTIVAYPYAYEILSDPKKCEKLLFVMIEEGFVEDDLLDLNVFRRLILRHGLIEPSVTKK